jgi:hypothetical protein
MITKNISLNEQPLTVRSKQAGLCSCLIIYSSIAFGSFFKLSTFEFPACFYARTVVRHIIETRNEQEIELHTTYFDTELLLR